MVAKTEIQKLGFGRIARQGVIAGVGAIVVNAILFFIGSAMGAFPADALTPMGVPVDIMAVVGFSVVSTIAAIVLCFLLHRFLSVERAKQVFLILAMLVLVGMAFNPLGIANAPILQIVLLEVMHLVLGGALVYNLLKA